MANFNKMAADGLLNEPGMVLHRVYTQLKELAVLISAGTFDKKEVLIALAAITDDIATEVENG